MAENGHYHEQLELHLAQAEIMKAYCDLMDEIMPHLSLAEQIVYHRLFRLSHVRQSPFTKCRYDALAMQCGLSLRTLQRALKGLKQKQLVKTVWQSHGATTFTVRLISQLPHRPAFLPRRQSEHSSLRAPAPPTSPPVYDAFSLEDRELYLACKRGLSPQRLNDLTEEAVEWLTERVGGDPDAFSDDLLRDKTDELVFREVFGVERRERYQRLFNHLYQQ